MIVFNLSEKTNSSRDNPIDTSLSISIYDKSISMPDARFILNDKIANLRKLSADQDFEIIKQEKMFVSGIQGDFVYYTLRFILTGESLDTKISYIREVYLDDKDKICVIRVMCYPEVNNQVEGEFSHIIKSFKFLH